MMLLLIGIPTIILLLCIFVWITGFLLVTDITVPLRKTRPLRRVLVIFPHADDETITCGGSLYRLARGGCDVTWLLLTRGERGLPRERHGVDQEIRLKEARKVATHLGISRLIQEDFGDGLLVGQKPELAAYIAEIIEAERPDLLITYDLAGFYGHADHIACSEVVTELKKTRFSEIALWYVTFPSRVRERIKMPTDLAIDPHVRTRQAVPTHKIWIGGSLLPKIKAWYAYQSQRAALASGIGRFVPIWLLWFFLSMVLFEYFAEVR